MRFPTHIMTDTIQNSVRNVLRGNKRYPFVLMLEPLYTCNLACIGCAIERHTGKLKDRLSIAQCIEAVERSEAPVVSICGGEPTIYPELPELVDEIIKRKRHIYLCTNGLLLDENVYDTIKPHKRLMINVHLDGMRETHDYVCARKGVFDKAIAMIEKGVELGHHMMANTTVFKETNVDEVEELCELLTKMGVEGMLVSPGYHYDSVGADIFLTKSEIHKKFKRVLDISKKYRLTSTPMFLEFAAGLREYKCSPWSTVTYTPERLEGALLPDRQDLVADLRRVLERHGLGVLGVAEGSALPELPDALGLRGVGRHGASQASRRHGEDDRLEPGRVASAPRSRSRPSRGRRPRDPVTDQRSDLESADSFGRFAPQDDGAMASPVALR